MTALFTLEENWSACERGNTLLVDDDGNMVAWIDIDMSFNRRMEVAFTPDNYPALSVGIVQLTDEQLAKHIRTKCGDWYARKLNIEGVELVDSHVVGDPYADMTTDDEYRLLHAIVAKQDASTLFAIGDVGSLLTEELNNEVLNAWSVDHDGSTEYSKISTTEFNEILLKIIDDSTAAQILSYGDVYSELREHFNNDILEAWEKEQST
jgi:hypothetical protein